MAHTTITIFVRHTEDCKYAGDEFARRCSCRKHLRWMADGKQHRRAAGTRSWEEAERVKRDLDDQLSGKVTGTVTTEDRGIRSAADLFISAKQIEGISAGGLKKYKLWLDRLATYCERHGVYTVRGITGEMVIGFCAGWEEQYPSSLTRNKLRERYKSFMKFCDEQRWIDRLPKWPKMAADIIPTLPLTEAQYASLLDAVYVTVKAPRDAVVENQTYEYWTRRLHGLFQLMRWSGLSIMDALTLPRAELHHRGGVYRVVTARTKTGTDVSVRIPADVAEELLAVPNDNKRFFFWSGAGAKKSICGNWGKRFIVPCFREAGIERTGHMLAHRLRDTFACDLLTKGVSIEDVSKLLGHRSVRVTEMHYGAWVQGRQDRLDEVVANAWSARKTTKRLPGRGSAAA